MRAFITKYALTAGIQSVEAEQCRTSSDMIRINGKLSSFDHYFHEGEWHATYEAARERAEEMRVKKVASLERQLAKLRRIVFPEQAP